MVGGVMDNDVIQAARTRASKAVHTNWRRKKGAPVGGVTEIHKPSYNELVASLFRLKSRNKRLLSTLRMVLESFGGHHHDGWGTNGADCPICQRQFEAQMQAWEVLRGIE